MVHSVKAQNLDSLRRIVLDPLQPDSERLFSFYDLIWNGYMDRDPDSALVLADSMQRFARSVDLQRHEGNACATQGAIYLNRGDLEHASIAIKASLKLFEACDAVKGQAGAWNNMAILHTRKGEHQLAIDAYEKAMRLFEKAGKEKGVANVLNNIGLIYFLQEDYVPAIDHFQRAYALLRTLGQLHYATNPLQNIGSCYSAMGDHLRAVQYSDACRAMCDSIGYEAGLPATLTTLGASLHALGRSKEAEVHLLRAVKLADRFSDGPNGALANISLGRIALARGETHEAVRFGERGLDLAEGMQGVMEQRDATQFLHEAYKKNGDPAKALNMFERSVVYRDSLRNEANQRSLLRHEYKAEYEAHAVIDRLNLAAEQKAKRSVMIAGALVACIAGLLLWLLLASRRNTRVVQAKNDEITRTQHQLVTATKLREAEQVRTRIARDIHDELGGDLTKVALLSTEIARRMDRTPEEVPALLQSLGRVSREANAALRDIVWSVDPEQDTWQGLVNHAEVYSNRILEGSNLRSELRFEFNGPDSTLDPASKQHIFLVLKEALNNAVKHAQATLVHVRLSTSPSGYELAVLDNGTGFEQQRGQSEGNGLRNMRTRADALQAALSLTSTPNGTHLELRGLIGA
ncbi:MAG: tetratricopeptide repeat protein [Flavobacteriales bacterium]|nr:tetratricopeptide repeat protein [Flavobacteriales bacterium]